VSGSDLFVLNNARHAWRIHHVGERQSNTSLVSGLSGPYGIAVSGSDLFVVDAFSGMIGEYTLEPLLDNYFRQIPPLSRG